MSVAHGMQLTPPFEMKGITDTVIFAVYIYVKLQKLQFIHFRLSTRLCKKKRFFLKGSIFQKKKVFVTKKGFFGGQMDKFSMPEKGIFTACILK